LRPGQTRPEARVTGEVGLGGRPIRAQVLFPRIVKPNQFVNKRPVLVRGWEYFVEDDMKYPAACLPSQFHGSPKDTGKEWLDRGEREPIIKTRGTSAPAAP
jgi:hypothetical protein